MNQNTNDNTPMVAFEKTQVLREALAHIGNYGTELMQARALAALRTWADSIKDECPHLEVARYWADGHELSRCVDCGAVIE